AMLIMANNDPGQCGANLPFTVTASDTCPGVVLECKVGATVITSPHFFDVGMTTVNCKATDAGGNMANCSFTVKVTDNEQTTITCPPPIMADTDPGLCTASMTFNVTSSDNCPGQTVECKTNATVITSPNVFPRGVTTVNCKVTDAAGLMNTCSFTVTVSDHE